MIFSRKSWPPFFHGGLIRVRRTELMSWSSKLADRSRRKDLFRSNAGLDIPAH